MDFTKEQYKNDFFEKKRFFKLSSFFDKKQTQTKKKHKSENLMIYSFFFEYNLKNLQKK